MEKIIFRRNYIFKVWGSTIIGAPLLIMILTDIIMSKGLSKLDSGALGFISFSIGYGFLLSIPTLLITYLIFHYLSKAFQEAFYLKLNLILIGVSSILLTFYLCYGKDAYNINRNYSALSFSISYVFCLTMFGIIFPLRARTHSL